MSDTGQMGATERLTWRLASGDVMTVTVDRGKLAHAMAAKLTGFGAQKRATALFGAVVATRTTADALTLAPERVSVPGAYYDHEKG